LKKYKTISIDENFVNYVLKNQDREVNLSEEQISKLEKLYLSKVDSIIET